MDRFPTIYKGEDNQGSAEKKRSKYYKRKEFATMVSKFFPLLVDIFSETISHGRLNNFASVASPAKISFFS